MRPFALAPSSPKLLSGGSERSRLWYPYYAGYSPKFVRDAIASLSLKSGGLVADPWNGAGTTTSVAQQMRVPSWGGDLNPAMVVVAKARLLGGRITPSETSITHAIFERLDSDIASSVGEGEPLRAWLRPDAADRLRSLERAIAYLLDPMASRGPPSTTSRVDALSPLASFFYLALFRTTRDILAPFRSSNPTWIRRPQDARLLLSPSKATIVSLFQRHVSTLTELSNTQDLVARAGKLEIDSPPVAADIHVARSTRLPLEAHSVDAVISSPPYCTRIDYAVATTPELSVLGLRDAQQRRLRSSLIGSSTVTASPLKHDIAWGPLCAKFLARVATHQSKASATYYLRNHLQYFDRLAQSLRELDRVLRPSAHCFLVVQDSHYKEIHNDLAGIVTEMAATSGWELRRRTDFVSTRNMARVHPGTKLYREHARATESVLLFRTPRR